MDSIGTSIETIFTSGPGIVAVTVYQHSSPVRPDNFKKSGIPWRRYPPACSHTTEDPSYEIGILRRPSCWPTKSKEASSIVDCSRLAMPLGILRNFDKTDELLPDTGIPSCHPEKSQAFFLCISVFPFRGNLQRGKQLKVLTFLGFINGVYSWSWVFILIWLLP